MIVHSLSGPSGTGKSTSALQFAFEHQIKAIIDDGLLIIDGEKKAGTSAKFEKNTITAVRRAIFQDDSHKKDVIEALRKYDVSSILIIGTSDKMTKKIADLLEIGPITHFHYVEEVRSRKEILIAQFVRGTQGKHVMPIPYKQVEQNFFKRFVQRGFVIFSKNRVKLGETTLVRPDFHHQTYTISKRVYTELIKHIVETNPRVGKVDGIHYGMENNFPIVQLGIYLKQPVTYKVVEELRGMQQQITNEFLTHFEFEPGKVKIDVKGII